MAKSYLGYVERSDEAYVDWASIGKTISDDLITVSNERKEKKAELDRQTNEAVNTINELTANQPQLTSEFYMDGANNTRQYLLMLDKQMKNGLLDPSEYAKKRQVILDGVDQLSAASKSFNEDYEDAMKRLQNGEAAAQEVFQNEGYDAFRSTESKSIYVNPADGRIYIATRDANGNVIKDPSKLLSVNNLYSRRKDKINKYDVVGESQKKVNVLGDYVKSVRRGGVLTLKDVMQRKEYLSAEADVISSMMASPRNAGSVLSDYVGGYTFTQDPKQAAGDPTKILLKQDGMNMLQPELTAEQRKIAEDALRAQLRVQLDRIETPMPIQQPTEAAIGRGERKQDNLAHLELVRKIYSGTENEAGVAADAIRALNPDIKSINKDENGNLTIKFTDGRVEKLPIPQTGTGSSGGFEQFATRAGGFLIPGLPIEQTFVDWQKSPYKGRSETYRADAFDSAGALDAKSEANRILTEANFTDATFALTEEDGLAQVERLLSKLGDGYTAEQVGWGQDQIEITTPGGVSFVLDFDYQDEKQQIAEFARLKTFLEEQVPLAEAAKAKKEEAKAASTTAPASAAASGGTAR